MRRRPARVPAALALVCLAAAAAVVPLLLPYVGHSSLGSLLPRSSQLQIVSEEQCHRVLHAEVVRRHHRNAAGVLPLVAVGLGGVSLGMTIKPRDMSPTQELIDQNEISNSG